MTDAESNRADRAVLNIAMAQPGWDGRFMSLAYEIRDRIQSLSDEGKSIDSGTGGDSADLWLWNDGREYFINIRLSNRMLIEQGKPIPFTQDWWRPIDTAPVPPREVLMYDCWPCLLQDKRGVVASGFAVYRRPPGAPQGRDAWRLQWFIGLDDNPGRSKVFHPVYWMPRPAPREVS